jgi:hypothetical protein
MKIKRICFICGAPILYKPSEFAKIKGNNCFCSKKCYGIYLSKKIDFSCKLCGSHFTRTPCQIRVGGGIFCSLDCQHKFYKGENHPNWKDGSTSRPYRKGFNKKLKRAIKDRDNHKCVICGVPEAETIQGLDVHHIDYNKDNHNINNLIALCHSCHARTNHNRDYWRNFLEGTVCPIKV